ncbi:hypothetical protein PIB30_081638, partial [Stylosanthes scabra]|nr:hypothetical protein [Stylosanthes scabra]
LYRLELEWRWLKKAKGARKAKRSIRGTYAHAHSPRALKGPILSNMCAYAPTLGAYAQVPTIA